MKLFKLTDGQGCTMGPTQWGEGVKHSVAADLATAEPELCSNAVIHVYKYLELGLIMNPLHANFRLDGKGLRIWEAEGDVVVESWDKVGCRELTTIKELPVPEWYWNSTLKSYVIGLVCGWGCREVGVPWVDYLYSNPGTLRELHRAGIPAEQLQSYAERAVAEVMRERHLY